jgi:hypothetical protein
MKGSSAALLVLPVLAAAWEGLSENVDATC